MPERLETLESKLAHLELAFDELNQVVYQQSKQLDAAEARIKKLQGRLKEVADEAQAQPFTPSDELPPHY